MRNEREVGSARFATIHLATASWGGSRADGRGTTWGEERDHRRDDKETTSLDSAHGGRA